MFFFFFVFFLFVVFFFILFVFFFFFKQKTAYEIMPSLVGSEMCIRDRDKPAYMDGGYYAARFSALEFLERVRRQAAIYVCLLYTSDAADDLLCVDLGGRR